jgi:hypothetical protein
MKLNSFHPVAGNIFSRFSTGFMLWIGTICLQYSAFAIPSTVDLGTSSSFAVLAGSGITVTGPTTIVGDIGSYPTTSVTGLGNVSLTGSDQSLNTGVMQAAKADLSTAYNDAAARAPDATYAGGADLGGMTLGSGVYKDASSLFLTGILTLDAKGDPNAVWIFQIGSTLITASGSQVDLIGGAQACHVFWQVGSSATLGTTTDFSGNILALTSITADTGAIVDGSLLAQNGAVTLDNNTITTAICSDTTASVPDGGTTFLLLSSGMASLFIFGRRLTSQAKSLAQLAPCV